MGKFLFSCKWNKFDYSKNGGFLYCFGAGNESVCGKSLRWNGSFQPFGVPLLACSCVLFAVFVCVSLSLVFFLFMNDNRIVL